MQEVSVQLLIPVYNCEPRCSLLDFYCCCYLRRPLVRRKQKESITTATTMQLVMCGVVYACGSALRAMIDCTCNNCVQQRRDTRHVRDHQQGRSATVSQRLVIDEGDEESTKSVSKYFEVPRILWSVLACPVRVEFEHRLRIDSASTPHTRN